MYISGGNFLTPVLFTLKSDVATDTSALQGSNFLF